MLENGLGEVIAGALPSSRGFADLFTGSGAVACHVAQRFDVPVRASDLQHFAVALADSVVGRTQSEPSDSWLNDWLLAASERAVQNPIWDAATVGQARLSLEALPKQVDSMRELAVGTGLGFCSAYGGWYYSPLQAIKLEALRTTLPSHTANRKVALAALISVASQCAASPGHTAQPFKPTETAGKFLLGAWAKEPIGILKRTVERLGPVVAKRLGSASVRDAATEARDLPEGWIAFVDPPYSSVHYSRFYHVLESLARGAVGEVSGAGRYPPATDRPSSAFSVPSRAGQAFDELFNALAETGAHAIVTFPNEGASNGITGEHLRDVASRKFRIVEEKISSRMSTMGGNRQHREARQNTVELILLLSPR